VNPINYARGLLAELEMAVGKHKTAVLAELSTVAEHLRGFVVSEGDKALHSETLAKVESALPKAK
jgi:hypothetical protein